MNYGIIKVQNGISKCEMRFTAFRENSWKWKNLKSLFKAVSGLSPFYFYCGARWWNLDHDFAGFTRTCMGSSRLIETSIESLKVHIKSIIFNVPLCRAAPRKFTSRRPRLHDESSSRISTELTASRCIASFLIFSSSPSKLKTIEKRKTWPGPK